MYGQRLFTGMVVVVVTGGWWLVVGVCMSLVLVWLVGGRSFLAFSVRSAFVRWRGCGWRLFAFGFGVVGWRRLLACGAPFLLALYVVGVCLLWFGLCCRSFGELSRLRLPLSFSQCVGRYASLEELSGVCR